MPECLWNVLREPLIRVRTQKGENMALTLPEVLAALGGEGLAAFVGLQPYQSHAWHAFLVQLAAMALHMAGEQDPEGVSAGKWLEMLLAMTDAREEPWCLIVEDFKKPAFFQPPVPEGRLENFKSLGHTPDGLTTMVLSKNHDLKATRNQAPERDHWIYALVTLQTMQGNLGAGNYGIARMNGGYGNRPCVTLVPDWDLGSRFKRDIDCLMVNRDKLKNEHGYGQKDDIRLLWLEPWKGMQTESLPLTYCDPYVIEVCRRIRLQKHDSGIEALTRATKSPRMAAKDLKGYIGDPWTPVNIQDSKSLTVDAGGFHYRKLHDLLFSGNFKKSITEQLRQEDKKGTMFWAQAMTRGQGKTEGLHERVVPIPPKACGFLFGAEKDRLAKRSNARIDSVKTMAKSVLKPVLLLLLQGAPESLNYKDHRADPWLDAFDREVDRIFFERLWADLDLDDPRSQVAWQRTLRDLAESQFDDALESAPVPAARAFRAFAHAKSVFYGSMRKQFPALFEKEDAHGEHATSTHPAR